MGSNDGPKVLGVGERPVGPQHAHRLVKETAEAMAHELYDTMMQDNQWYELWRKQNPGASARALESRFVKRNLARLVPAARATLAGMLRGTTSPEQKDQICEALCLDATLIRGRAN